MKRCGKCHKTLWPWQGQMQVKWVTDYENKPEGVTERYHNPACLSPADFRCKNDPPKANLANRMLKPKWWKFRCDMCGGFTLKLTVMLDPNKFPANDPFNYDDCWHTCRDCRDFINEGTAMSFAMHAETVLAKARGEKPDYDKIMAQYGWGGKDAEKEV